MGMKLTGTVELERAFSLLGSAVRKAAAEALHREGEAIADTSRSYAPVDKHNLEQAHAVETEATGPSITTTISVGGTVNGVNVDAYAAHMHEGVYNLGPGSLAKAATGLPVGPKFLERALMERAPEVGKNVGEAVRDALRCP